MLCLGWQAAPLQVSLYFVKGAQRVLWPSPSIRARQRLLQSAYRASSPLPYKWEQTWRGKIIGLCQQPSFFYQSLPTSSTPSVPKQTFVSSKTYSAGFINECCCLWSVTHSLPPPLPPSNTVYTTVMSAASPEKYQTWIRTAE